LLAAAFGFRVVATPAAWGCLTDGAGVPGHAGHHQHHPDAPGSPPPACACIPHAPGLSVDGHEPRLTAAAPLPPQPVRTRIADDTRPVTANRHLLPFPVGPPASIA
jgi:hypothetical protein